MLSLAEDTIAGLRAFLNQRDDLILVLDAADRDLPAGLKIIEGLDTELSWVWGWVFVESFADPVSWGDHPAARRNRTAIRRDRPPRRHAKACP